MAAGLKLVLEVDIERLLMKIALKWYAAEQPIVVGLNAASAHFRVDSEPGEHYR